MTTARIIQVGALLITLTVLGSCAPTERVLGNLYDGVQMQNRQAAPPNVEAPVPTPGYDEYLRQRREVIKETRPNEEAWPGRH